MNKQLLRQNNVRTLVQMIFVFSVGSLAVASLSTGIGAAGGCFQVAVFVELGRLQVPAGNMTWKRLSKDAIFLF